MVLKRELSTHKKSPFKVGLGNAPESKLEIYSVFKNDVGKEEDTCPLLQFPQLSLKEKGN